MMDIFLVLCPARPPRIPATARRIHFDKHGKPVVTVRSARTVYLQRQERLVAQRRALERVAVVETVLPLTLVAAFNLRLMEEG